MIYLITGQPGHGKTLRAMQLALEFQAKGRDVYVAGVRGLKAGEAGFIELDDPRKWQELPDGGVIVLDECYSVFPRRMAGAKVPAYIEALATHRHRGFDFILICQQAKQQIDGFLLGLVQSHEHVRRRFGLKKSVILSWDKFAENTNDSVTKTLWSFPSSVMKRNLYESTVQDTTQKKIPWFVWALPIALLVLVALVWKVYAWFHPDPVQAQASATSASAAPGQGMVFGQGSSQRRPDDFVKWLTPRITGQPWTAPAYDDRPVVSEPELYCMALETGDCNCITEQGTRYVVEPQLCRAIVYNGGTYNPTRRPAQRQEQAQQRQDVPQTYTPAPAPAAVGVSAAGLNRGVGIGGNYTGPEYRPWNSDPFGDASGKR